MTTFYIATFRTNDGTRLYVSQHRSPIDFWIGNVYRDRAYGFESVAAARAALDELHYGPERSCVLLVIVADGAEESLRRVWPLTPLEELAKAAG